MRTEWLFLKVLFCDAKRSTRFPGFTATYPLRPFAFPHNISLTIHSQRASVRDSLALVASGAML